MKIRICFELAIRNILSNKTRSLLTMLGIIIGIMSVITLTSLMGGVTGEVTGMFDEMGTTSINIMVQGRGSSRQVNANDIYKVANDHQDLFFGASPSVSVNAKVKTRTSSEDLTTTATGVSEVYANMKKLTFTEGGFFNYIDVERLQNVCVIGSYIQDYLFGNTSGFGETIKINGIPYKIVGILEEKAGSAKGSSDECIYIPYTNATRINGQTAISNFAMYATSEETVDRAVQVLETELNQILGSSDYYTVISLKELRDNMNSITHTMTIALVFIAGISLLVGGIGIMNIMLVTVTERTKEIGIRKALGTKKRDIMYQFVIEAATLSCIGGMIGILFGIILSKVVGMVVSINIVPSVTSILLSFGVSSAIGIGFGYLPAKRAAALNPIDALRFE